MSISKFLKIVIVISLTTFSNTVQSQSFISTISELQMYSGNQYVHVKGYYTEGDGGGGHFMLKTTSSSVNDGTVFNSSSTNSNEKWIRVYDGDLNVKWFGAIPNDNISDNIAIQKAINLANSQGGGTVYFPTGSYLIKQSLELKSLVALKGSKAENGWARQLDYSFGSEIKVSNGANCDAIIIDSAANWVLEDIIINGNKLEQSLPGYNCVKIFSNIDKKSHGGLIRGCKFVNPVEFSLYVIKAGPMDISESFFMSGMFIANSADINITGCSIDGTNGKHPSMFFSNLSSSNFSNNLCWGWADAFIAPDTFNTPELEYKYTSYNVVNIDPNGTISVTNESGLYDGMPVLLQTIGNYPSLYVDDNGKDVKVSNGLVLYLHNTGILNKWELYNSPYGNVAGKKIKYKELNNTNGIFTLEYGGKSAALITGSNRLRFTSNRIAGSIGSALTCQVSNELVINSNSFWRMNLDREPEAASVALYDVKWSTISGNTLGERDTVEDYFPLVDYSLKISSKYTDWTDAGNVVGVNSYGEAKIAYIRDDYSGGYSKRNFIQKTGELYSESKQTIISDNYRKDHAFVELYDFNENITVVSGSTANLTLKVNQSSFKEKDYISSAMEIPFEQRVAYKIKGQIGIQYEGCWANGGCKGDILVKLLFISNNKDGNSGQSVVSEKRFIGKITEEFAGVDYPLTIPIESIFYKEFNSDDQIKIQIFHNLTSSLIFDSDTKYSWLSVEKITDIPFKN